MTQQSKKYLPQLLLAVATFAVGVAITRSATAVGGVFNRRQGLTQISCQPQFTAQLKPQPLRDTELEPGPLTPLNIESFVNSHPRGDLKNLWSRLGIAPVNYNFLLNCEACGAETFRYEIDGEPGSEALVRVVDHLYMTARYLVFQREPNSPEAWRLLGHIDATGKYRMPQHTILMSEGRPFLIVQEQGSSGSGVESYIERLFQVSSWGLKEVFAYTAEGDQSGIGDDPTREFSAHIVSCNIKGGLATVEMESSVSYFIADESNPEKGILIFTKNQKAVFIRELNGGKQVLLRGRSDLSAAELAAVYATDSLSNEDFLKYNYSQLSGIASGADVNKRDWLQRFLNGCENTLEKRQVLKLLSNHVHPNR